MQHDPAPVCAAGEFAPCGDYLTGVESLGKSPLFDAFCAVLTTGGVDCWGDDNYGDLGHGEQDETETSPEPMCTGSPDTCSTYLGNVSALYSDGDDQQCALLDSGGVDCLGYNDYGQVGDGTTDDTDVATPVSGLTGVVGLSDEGADANCAVLSTGMVECWGSNFEGQLGDGTDSGPETCGSGPCSTVPVDVTGLKKPKLVVGSTSLFGPADHTAFDRFGRLLGPKRQWRSRRRIDE